VYILQTGANGEDYLKCDSEADVDGLKKLLDFEADGEDNHKYCEADEEGYEKYNQIMMMVISMPNCYSMYYLPTIICHF
jgi:hypothetical protein